MKIRFLRAVLHNGQHTEPGTILDVQNQTGLNLIAGRVAEMVNDSITEPEEIVNHDPAVESRDPQPTIIPKRRGRPPKIQ